MVAELLRLRFRILVNGFRRRPAQVIGLVFALLLAIAGTAAVWFGSAWISQWEDHFVFSAIVTVGTWLSVAALLIPMMAIRHSSLSARAFLGYDLSPLAVGLTFLLFALIGPGILLVPIAISPVNAWPDETSVQVAWAAAPLLFLQGLLTIKLGRRAGVALRRKPRLGAWVDFFGMLTLVLGGVIVLVELAPRIPALLWVVRAARPLNEFFSAVPQWLANTPFGMLWAAPEAASVQGADPEAAWQTLGYGVVLVLVLLVAWFAIIGYELRPTRRRSGPRRARVPGWFAHFPSNPTGAVAARSLTYWVRDPRYFAVFALVPVVPLLMLLVFWVGGVPFEIAVLVPLPVMVLLLAWSILHNDVAYDSTAIWQHVAAHTRGSHDRRGRAVPVLIWGALLLVIGLPLTVWGYGDLSVAAPLAGVCIALLLGGIGIANAYSARFPYAAPRPGDAAWQAPQVAGSQGGVAQAMSVLLTVLIAVPALLASAVWWVEGGWWGWIALGAGALSGLIAFAAGVRGGGAAFDRRAPELLAFTQRS